MKEEEEEHDGMFRDIIHEMRELFHELQDLRKFVDLQIELAKVVAQREALLIVSNTLTTIVVSVLGVFFLGFASVAGGLWLGRWFESVPMGFTVVGGFYLALMLFVVARKDWFDSFFFRTLYKVYARRIQLAELRKRYYKQIRAELEAAERPAPDPSKTDHSE